MTALFVMVSFDVLLGSEMLQFDTFKVSRDLKKRSPPYHVTQGGGNSVGKTLPRTREEEKEAPKSMYARSVPAQRLHRVGGLEDLQAAAPQPRSAERRQNERNGRYYCQYHHDIFPAFKDRKRTCLRNIHHREARLFALVFGLELYRRHIGISTLGTPLDLFRQ